MKKIFRSLWISLGILALAEMINGAENAALWRNASQLTDMGVNWIATKAVDGLRDTCTHTSLDVTIDPWWIVDLVNQYQVYSISVTNRNAPTLYQRINGAVIRVGNYPNNFDSNRICAVISSIPSGATASFSCTGTVGRYVIIYLVGDQKVLNLCEVEVYGNVLDNLAYNGSVIQSSTFGDWSAERAIDGDRGLQQIGTGCSSTQNETNPWWRLDLRHIYKVNRVVVTNRNDCCAELIDGVEIHIGNSLENNGNDNPICAVIPDIPAGKSISYSCNGREGRYVNLIAPGDLKQLTLCEVEVFGKGPAIKRSLVKLRFNSSADLTDLTMTENILLELGSVLADRGFTDVTLSWFEKPKAEIQEVETVESCKRLP